MSDGDIMLLRTQRLIIRNYREGDLEDFHEIVSSPAVMLHCEPVYDRETSARTLRHFIDNSIAFAVVEAQSDKLIGHALFKQMPGEEQGIYEIGWIYNERYWGRGYAYEASKALIEYGFGELGVHKFVAETTDPIKSVALMKKLGMKEEGVLREQTRNNSGGWVDIYWYGLLSTDL